SLFFLFVSPPPPRSTLFPSRRSSDLFPRVHVLVQGERVREIAHGFPGLGEGQGADLALVACRPGGRGRELEHREAGPIGHIEDLDRKSTRLNSSHLGISYAVFCLKKK